MRISYLLLSCATVVLLLGGWYVAAAAQIYPDFILPSPLIVLETFRDTLFNGYAGKSFELHYGITLMRVGIGFVMASIIGVILGILMGMSSKANAIVDPFIEFYRPLPPLAYLSLIIIWLGTGEVAKITLLFLTALAPIVIGTASGVKHVIPERINGVKSLGASNLQVFLYVILPSCVPEIFTGMRLAFAWTYSTIIAAEMIAANSGLGFMVLHAERYLRTDVIFMAIFVMAITGILLERGLRWSQRKLAPWTGKA